MSSPTSPYDELAENYHWLFDDEYLSGEGFLSLYDAVLRKLPAGAEVLDCACGAGHEVIALARAGYRLTACDASAGMVGRARHNLARAALSVPVTQCRWEELPRRHAGRFAAVFCVGNSISHADGPAEMVGAFRAMRDVLAPGGLLVVESRDWETMRAENRRFELPGRLKVREGTRGFVMFVWTIPPDLDTPHKAELVFVLERGDEIDHHVVELSFHAYTRQELVERLRAAGFGEIELTDTFPARYIATARLPT